MQIRFKKSEAGMRFLVARKDADGKHQVEATGTYNGRKAVKQEDRIGGGEMFGRTPAEHEYITNAARALHREPAIDSIDLQTGHRVSRLSATDGPKPLGKSAGKHDVSGEKRDAKGQWTKRGQKEFDEDELNQAILGSLTDEEALAMINDPHLFTEKKRAIEAKSSRQVAETLRGYNLKGKRE